MQVSNILFNETPTSLWINLGDGKCGFLEVRAPQKKLEKRKSE